MLDGKKNLAEHIVYRAFDIVAEKSGKDAMEVFDAAVKNTTPLLEVRPRRVGGATYQVPIEVRPQRRQSLAIRWLVQYARNRQERTMDERLANEILDASQSAGGAVKKRDEMHRMADANKAFAHYRW
jgi:small subunit ribosomal protein S7